jgi:hypothetical protein
MFTIYFEVPQVPPFVETPIDTIWLFNSSPWKDPPIFNR